uniref:Uncharacterized protein n=1 Tax=Cladonia uncialis subsp. uncialis TaxID=180999 RepID=A0A2K9YE95_CLAUC|nr:hypothetical protein [Cladonia uncialis subsp. uncialis]
MSPNTLINGTLSNLNNTLSGTYTNSTDDTVTLTGSHFKNPLFLAPIAINATCALAFIILTTASWLKKRDIQGSRRVFAAMITLLVAMTSSFIRTLIDEVIHEYEFSVPKAYLILPSLKPVLDNSTMIGLVAMMYHIAKNRNQWVCGDSMGYLWWQRAHHLAVTTLTLFALADTVLYIYAQVLLWGQIDVSQINPKVLEAANSYGQVHITYTTLYLVVTIEILVWAICVAWKAWQQNLRSRIITYVVILISPFLILRSATTLVFAVLYTYESHTEARWTGVIETALWGLPSIAIFTGLVLIQYRKDWQPDYRYENTDAILEHGPVTETVNVVTEWPDESWKGPHIQRYYSH